MDEDRGLVVWVGIVLGLLFVLAIVLFVVAAAS